MSDDATITLASLAGAQAPPGLADQLRSITSLPAVARQRFMDVLEPHLFDAVDDRVEPAVKRFCREHEVSPAALVPAVAGCRLLFRPAALLDVEEEALASDLTRLLPGEEDLCRQLGELYRAARPKIRRHMIVNAIAEHGKLVVGIDWRIDTINTSQRGGHASAKVGLVTFRYREGSEPRRVTLQMLPDSIKELQTACARMLS